MIATNEIDIIFLNCSKPKHGPYKKKKCNRRGRRLFGGRNIIDLINLS